MTDDISTIQKGKIYVTIINAKNEKDKIRSLVWNPVQFTIKNCLKSWLKFISNYRISKLIVEQYTTHFNSYKFTNINDAELYILSITDGFVLINCNDTYIFEFTVEKGNLTDYLGISYKKDHKTSVDFVISEFLKDQKEWSEAEIRTFIEQDGAYRSS